VLTDAHLFLEISDVAGSKNSVPPMRTKFHTSCSHISLKTSIMLWIFYNM